MFLVFSKDISSKYQFVYLFIHTLDRFFPQPELNSGINLNLKYII